MTSQQQDVIYYKELSDWNLSNGKQPSENKTEISAVGEKLMGPVLQGSGFSVR